jgi:hypothetical protein
MSQELTKFLTQLSTDKELVEAFKNDDVATMKAHNIDEKHIDLVTSGNYDEIQNLLGADYKVATNKVIKAFKI